MRDDLISRKAAIDAVHEEFDECLVWDESGERTANEFETIINRLPSAQPEVIRCKDCKHSEHWYADKGRCFLWHDSGIDVFEDGFCNYAERRED